MQITRHNVQEQLPFILECLKKSQFVAFDFELTGIQYNSKYQNTSLDSVDTRYTKLRYNVQKFAPIQLGICGFQILNDKEIISYPFNIQICPFSVKKGQTNNFSVSASAFNFLDSHGMDFNSVFKDGVFFCSKLDQQIANQTKVVENIKKDERSENKGAFQKQSEEQYIKHKKEIDEMFSQNSRKRVVNIVMSYHSDQLCRIFEKLVLQDHPNALFEVKFKNQYYVKDNNIMSIKKVPKSKEKEFLQEKQRQKDLWKTSVPDNIEPDLELRAIFDYISLNKIPLISHNGIYDLMHVFDKFYQPLPETVGQFKNNFSEIFPVIYDTKFLMSMSESINQEVYKNTTLRYTYERLYKYNSIQPVVRISEQKIDASNKLNNNQIDKNQKQIDNNDKQNITNTEIDQLTQVQAFSDYKVTLQDSEGNNRMHEGGYDAFITGFVFFQSLKVLKVHSLFKNFQKNSEKIDKKLKFFKNQVPLSGVRSVLKFQKEDDEISRLRNDIFYVQFIGTQKIQSQDFMKQFSEKYSQIKVYLTHGLEYEFYFNFNNFKDRDQFKDKFFQKGYQLFTFNDIDCIIYTEKVMQEKIKGYLSFESEQIKEEIVMQQTDNI